MNIDLIEDNPYLLLTPGPLSTSKRVKAAMLKDWCTWDDDYNRIVQDIRTKLVQLATKETSLYTSVLMQGSGSFCVESVIGSVIPQDGKILVMANGAYGQRMAQMAKMLNIPLVLLDNGEVHPPDLDQLEYTLRKETDITHVAVVHCETTTGMLNPIEAVGRIVKKYNKTYIVDAMSSFGGIPLDIAELQIDFLISSANKCIQGVPGFGFIIAKIDEMKKCAGWARSHSLDLFDQWDKMEKYNGKWRFTSPTHVVRAFYEALKELADEGGVVARYNRYKTSQRALVKGMKVLGFETLLPEAQQSPIITSFLYPGSDQFQFQTLYEKLKRRGFVIYPGKITNANTFRIGNIGEVEAADMIRLVDAIQQEQFWT
ncbi:2-aminoethylphosphonate--pyruvate transaminase [Paenibacillus sp. CGMCC 1.16610]|uniref:2-aminoethylphosphonate--pyruvate transaminase n=1 Tax=Paenibacillus anseongense TaxID=2682845 RepID=A0ABW9UC47_9BACL|nr:MULTISPECIES: 2-aminoethylphosphonate--pyruvate transaminase [Paenibacillus]MBA2938430.1 2-aminoethylphosphonate--pyruvate transaminase [Paenibacillus sp. CGMCC 1.16610]MVQ37488.1 2-aminoethylphosphonate--pyruvate transaminase [Paenibacillus anseongense]